MSRIGEYCGLPSVWIDFDYGERKRLSLEHGRSLSAHTAGGGVPSFTLRGSGNSREDLCQHLCIVCCHR